MVAGGGFRSGATGGEEQVANDAMEVGVEEGAGAVTGRRLLPSPTEAET